MIGHSDPAIITWSIFRFYDGDNNCILSSIDVEIKTICIYARTVSIKLSYPNKLQNEYQIIYCIAKMPI